MHFCKPPTNHIADDIGGVVSKTLTVNLFECPDGSHFTGIPR